MAGIIAISLTTIAVLYGFFLLLAYIVHRTGNTQGFTDVGSAVAAVIAALKNLMS